MKHWLFRVYSLQLRHKCFMHSILARSRPWSYCRALTQKIAYNREFVNKMATRGAGFSGNGRSSPRLNGFDRIPRPFLIGVAGGTASGKVRTWWCGNIRDRWLLRNTFEGIVYNHDNAWSRRHGSHPWFIIIQLSQTWNCLLCRATNATAFSDDIRYY